MDTQALRQSMYGLVPTKEMIHNPAIRDKFGRTVAMNLSFY